MQGISVLIKFPERVAPSVLISLAKTIYDTIRNSVSPVISLNNCHIEIVDSLTESTGRCYGTK